MWSLSSLGTTQGTFTTQSIFLKLKPLTDKILVKTVVRISMQTGPSGQSSSAQQNAGATSVNNKQKRVHGDKHNATQSPSGISPGSCKMYVILTKMLISPYDIIPNTSLFFTKFLKNKIAIKNVSQVVLCVLFF